MEATTILYKIRHQGFTITAMSGDIHLAPKRLLNDQMIAFVKSHKSELLTALYQEQDQQQAEHIIRKGALRSGRLVILRNLIKQCHSDDWCDDAAHWQVVEDCIDRALQQFDYDLEIVIDHYRSIAPPFKIIDPRCKCGYMTPFCTCNKIHGL